MALYKNIDPNITIPQAILFKSAQANIWFLDNGVILFSNLYAIDRGKGHASGLIERVCDIADQNNYLVRLEARQYSDPHGLTTHELIEFYSRHGFILDPKRPPDTNIMERPRKNYTGYNDTSLTPERTTS